MSKTYRHQAVIAVNRDSEQQSDYWLKQFESNLSKTSVLPANVFEEINSIVNHNRHPKYPSVQAAVDEMMTRSGLTQYLKDGEQTKLSQPDNITPKKIAQVSTSEQLSNTDKTTPEVIKLKPSIQTTLENIINDSHGLKPISAIIDKLHSLHALDIADESVWNDEKLKYYVSRLNLQAKTNNPDSYEQMHNLGKRDVINNDEMDVSNTDAFHALQPAKI